MRRKSLKFLLAGGLILAAAGCSSEDFTYTDDDDAAVPTGAARLELPVDAEMSSVTAIISGTGGFEPETHVIDVHESGVASVLFGGLPVGDDFKIELSAGVCEALATFRLFDGETTLLPITWSCQDDEDGESSEEEEDSAIEDLFERERERRGRRCDHVRDIDASPRVQRTSDSISRVKLSLDRDVTAASIAWSSTSLAGGSGTIGSLSGTTDTEVTFDCSTNGRVVITADVTALERRTSCVDQARVVIRCRNQEPTEPQCGDGTLDPGEQCDGTAGVGSCPTGTTGAVTCTNQCTRNTSGCTQTPVCGNGVVNPPEQCDGTAGVGSCPAGTTGTVTCNANCTRNTSACVQTPVCGNGVVNPPEQCDGTAGVGTCPAGTTGAVTCNTNCTRNTSGCVTEPPPLGECGICARDNCGTQRAVVDANLPTVDPIIACVLGPDWEQGNRAAATSCGNSDLLTCYCGTLAGQDCSNAAPSALDGQCVDEVLAGTGCTTSACVAPIFLNPANSNGKAMQYIQCQQDFCYDTCFN